MTAVAAMLLLPILLLYGIVPTKIERLAIHGRTLVGEAHLPAAQQAAALIVVIGGRPAARLLLAPPRLPAGPARFAGSCSRPITPADAVAAYGYLISPDLIARCFDQWPTDVNFHASVDALGPGAATAWISAGALHGIEVGQSWWQRTDGQPLARFDVLSVEPACCFCSVTQLAADVALAPGERVALWPAPGRARLGQVHSAVSFIEPGDGARVWLAAPPGADVPPDAAVTFERDGRAIAVGNLDGLGERFWYARVNGPVADPSAAGEGPGAVPNGTASDTAATAEDAAGTVVRVGDTALIRSTADIRERRWTGRVFASTTEGQLIDAGEAEGLAPDQVLYWTDQQWNAHGLVIRRVQRGYSIAVPTSAAGNSTQVGRSTEANRPTQTGEKGESEKSGEPAAADNMRSPAHVTVPPLGTRVGPGLPRSDAHRIGRLSWVDPEAGLFEAALQDADLPLPALVTILRNDRPIGAAIVLEAAPLPAAGAVPPARRAAPNPARKPPIAAGFFLLESLTTAPRPGDTLALPR